MKVQLGLLKGNLQKILQPVVLFFDWPDEDLPPPPGSAPVLTDDYSEIFPETPPEYEVVEDDPPPLGPCPPFDQGIPPDWYTRPAPIVRVTKGFHPMDLTASEMLSGNFNYCETEPTGYHAVAGVPYTSADFDRNNDPYYFDKISRESRCNACSQKYLINLKLKK